jgi:hypothetical protein
MATSMCKRLTLVTLLLVSAGVAGCGLTVPDIKEPWEVNKPPSSERHPGASGTAQLEFEIKKRIFCDLREAVQAADRFPLREARIPEEWGAQLSLTLQVDETTSLNPGVTLNTSYPTVISYPAKAVTPLGMLAATTTSQSFGLGFGATLSSTATRQDKFDPYYSMKTLKKPIDKLSVCYDGPPYTKNDPFLTEGWTPASSSPFVVESDLGITEWLIGAMQFSHVLPSDVPQLQQKTPLPKGTSENVPDTITLEIKFIIVTSGNVTPTWKLARISANTGSSPLFNTGRTRTHDLIITIGNPSQIASTHLASQIGNSVSNGNKAAAMGSQ